VRPVGARDRTAPTPRPAVGRTWRARARESPPELWDADVIPKPRSSRQAARPKTSRGVTSRVDRLAQPAQKRPGCPLDNPAPGECEQTTTDDSVDSTTNVVRLKGAAARLAALRATSLRWTVSRRGCGRDTTRRPRLDGGRFRPARRGNPRSRCAGS